MLLHRLFCLCLVLSAHSAMAQEPVVLGGATGAMVTPSSPASLLELQEKINTLEATLQGQTQQIEDLQKTVRTLEQRLPAEPKPTAEASPETVQEAASNEDVTENTPASTETPAVLGTVPPSKPLAETSSPASPQGKYQGGIDALKQGRYAEAREHLNTFIKENPDDKLIPNAYYWMGEAYYAEGNYRKAGETFLKGFQDYPESPKAPDSLLKLGLSLQSAKQTKQACQSFDELMRRYPDASPGVINRAKRAKASCA
jgi:tol-pal system protein YbgF